MTMIPLHDLNCSPETTQLQMDFLADQLARPTFVTTWVVLFISVGLCLAFIFLLLRPLLDEGVWKGLTVTSIAVFITGMTAEALLRVTGYTENYSEARLGYYNFICHGCYQDTLHVWSANDTHEIGDGVQFLYPRTTNSLGLSDREWEKEKPDSVYRIIALGDSFTEGDGAPADSAWPRLLEQQLLNEDMPVEVFNAGVCGSDPFGSLMLLRHRLLDYHPDLVIMTLSMQDLLEDIAIKGGMERFDPERGQMPLFFEWIYAYSHISRLVYNRVLGYSWVLVKEDSKQFVERMAMRHIPELFQELSLTAEKGAISLVLYPHFGQTIIDYGVYTHHQALYESVLREARKHGVALVDIRPCYRRYIEASSKEAEDFWWKNDGHHNPEGYLMMAKCIRENIELNVP